MHGVNTSLGYEDSYVGVLFYRSEHVCAVNSLSNNDSYIRILILSKYSANLLVEAFNHESTI